MRDMARRPAEQQQQLVVGETADVFEREADAVADRVMQAVQAPASAVNGFVAGARVQRDWSDAPLGPIAGARSSLATAPSFGWNRGEVSVGGMRRIPVEGLTLGNTNRNIHAAAEEAANQRAIAVIPAGLNATVPVEVLLHFHGHNVGYRQRKTQGISHPTLAPGTVRDIDTDQIEQQLESSHRPIVGVLPQGTTASGFGTINSDAYIADVFRALTAMGVWAKPPAVSRVVLSGHSGGGLPISEMMSEAGQPRFPSSLGEIALFDAINGPNEFKAVQKWVFEQLGRDLATLTTASTTPVQQLQFLGTSLRFRAYYTNSSYAPRHIALQQAIDGWFSQHASALGGVSSATYKALYANYHVFAAGHAEHEVIMSRGGRLLDALSALPGAAGGAGSGSQSAPAGTSRQPPVPIQRHSENGAPRVSVAPPIVHDVLRSPGQPLDNAARGFFESRFRHDFGSVRVHADETAAEAASAVRAHAFTVGRDLVFGAGMYAPATQRGRKLIAHELAHVVQQGARDASRGRLSRVAWTPTRTDERDAATGTDRFAAQTSELTISSLAGLDGVITTESIAVSVFVPHGATVPGRNKVHIFFGPGGATETGVPATDVGLNAVMTHGLRGASDATEWILIGVPGRSGPRGEQEGFFTIDTAAVATALRAAGRVSTTIDALRYTAHSRGYRGLRETLNRHLVSGPPPERVVILDAAYGSVNRALTAARIPGSRQFAYNVTAGTSIGARGATNISISPNAARAIGYTRIIRDAMTGPSPIAVPPAVATQLLTLPARGSFTTHSPPAAGMTNITAFTTANAAAIAAIVAKESRPDGLKTFIDNNNLIRLGSVFPAGVYSHHLFVAEIAQELVD